MRKYKHIKLLIGQLGGKKSLERHRQRWKDDVETSLKKYSLRMWTGVIGVRMGSSCRAIASPVVSHCAASEVGSFMVNRVPVAFCSRLAGWRVPAVGLSWSYTSDVS
jgi:hypothetical protein